MGLVKDLSDIGSVRESRGDRRVHFGCQPLQLGLMFGAIVVDLPRLGQRFLVFLAFMAGHELLAPFNSSSPAIIPIIQTPRPWSLVARRLE